MKSITTELARLLIEERAVEGQPLFPTAAKLAYAISKTSPDKYKNPATAGALVRFVLRGDRRCSEGLRDAIQAAVRQRVKDVPKMQQESWKERVNQAVDALNRKADEVGRSPRDEEQFQSLLRAARAADVHFIVTPATAEIQKGLTHAEELTSLLIDRLGLGRGASAAPRVPTYKFLLPDQRTAVEHWRRLITDVTEASGDTRKDALAKLQVLERRRLLCVYVVPSYVCGCPIVVFNPDSNSRVALAFSFGYHRENIIDCIQWDSVAIEHWQTNVFSKIEFIDEEMDVEKREQQIRKRLTFDKFVGYRVPAGDS